MKPWRYLLAYSLPVTVAVSFTQNGWLTFLPLIYGFGIIPIIDQWLGPRANSRNEVESNSAASNRLYDAVIYLAVPVQWAMLLWFCYVMRYYAHSTTELVGRITAMGMMCGVLGINVAHELGHRTKRYERIMAKTLLLSSLYLHFYIEHNKGHHRNVGTSADGATARKNEWIYIFWLRTIVRSFFSAWEIQMKELKRKKLSFFNTNNEMLWMLVVQVGFIATMYWVMGIHVVLCFLAAAAMGILLLETVNYIEHYGLYRTKVNEFRYEDVEPEHSWNADHVWGRLVLFELTRHSDHHWEPAKHYQMLGSIRGASQLPAGYPAMMLLALCPPLWFRVMNHRLPK